MAKHSESTNKDRQTRKRAAAAYSDAAPAEKGHSESTPSQAELNQPAQEETLVETIEEKVGEVAQSSLSEEIEALKNEIERLKAQSAEYFDGWQRERADFLNYKRRQERDQAQLRSQITGEIIKRYLAIHDDLELALKNQPKDPENSSWGDGIGLILRKLQGILEAEGVQRIESENQQFDPNVHEAITLEDSPDHESNQIIEVVQQGYKLGDRVLRPARVRVAR